MTTLTYDLSDEERDILAPHIKQLRGIGELYVRDRKALAALVDAGDMGALTEKLASLRKQIDHRHPRA